MEKTSHATDDIHVIEITDIHTGSTHRNIFYDDVQTFIDEIYTNKTELQI